MATGREEWKNTGEELGGAFKNLAKSLIRTGKAGAEKVGDWADSQKDEYAGKYTEQSVEDGERPSTVFNDGTWRETGKGLGKAFAGLGSAIMGSAQRGADKAEEWVDDAKAKMENKVENMADKAEQKADDIKKEAADFADGFREGADGEVVADAQIISEEIVEK